MNFHTGMPSIRALSARLAEMPDPGKTMTPIGSVASQHVVVSLETLRFLDPEDEMRRNRRADLPMPSRKRMTATF